MREAYETMLQTVSKHDVIEEDCLIAFLQSTTSSLGLTPAQADLLVDYLDAPDVWFLHAHAFTPHAIFEYINVGGRAAIPRQGCCRLLGDDVERGLCS